MRDSETEATILRIKVLEKPIILQMPGDSRNRIVLKPSEDWEEAISPAHPFGWIILPHKEDHGLPLDQWLTLWDDLRVEVEAQRPDGTWSDLFE